MPLKDILADTKNKMAKAEEHLLHEFTSVRTGKASPGLVENLQVEAYGGSMMRLIELANITTPEPRALVIQPWDASTVHAIEKAIQKSNLGLNPTIDKKVIRIFLPDLSRERRQELIKVVKKMSEDARVRIRLLRRDAIEALKKAGKAGGVTEDEITSAEKDAQKLTDLYIKNIDTHLDHKEKEILTV